MSDGPAGGRGTAATGATQARTAAGAAREPVTAHPSGDERFAALDRAIRRVRASQDQLIELLHVAQEVFGYLSEDVLVYVARQLRLPQSRVYGVATFYHLFTFDPPGANTCSVCTGTACFVKGADDIVRAVSEAYGLVPGGTTGDGQLTLSTARCLGSCGLAPVVILNGRVRGHEQPGAVLEALEEAMASPAPDGLATAPPGSTASDDQAVG